MQYITFLELNERDSWFQEDRATCHSAQTSMEPLLEFYGDQLILQGLWPSRFPDIFLSSQRTCT